MVSVSLDVILEELSPAFDSDPGHHAVFALFLTVRHICNFGSKALLRKPDPPRHRHSALGEVHALTYTTFFVPLILRE